MRTTGPLGIWHRRRWFVMRVVLPLLAAVALWLPRFELRGLGRLRIWRGRLRGLAPLGDWRSRLREFALLRIWRGRLRGLAPLGDWRGRLRGFALLGVRRGRLRGLALLGDWRGRLRGLGTLGVWRSRGLAFGVLLPLLAILALELAGRPPHDIEPGSAPAAAEAHPRVLLESSTPVLPPLRVVPPAGRKAEPPRDQPPAHRARPVVSQAATPEAASESPPPSPRRILVSLKKRMLWLVDGRDTLLAAPVAVGMGEDFVFEGRSYRFETPVGRRRVLAKEKDPLWTVPEWHYYEKAVKQGLHVVKLEADKKVELDDGSFIVIQDGEVGRINPFGHFAPFTPGVEIIFDGTIFIPPMNTPQRKVPDALGPYKLDTGGGYLIHGTHMYTHDTIGEAASHGCVRMRNDDLERLYRLVQRGTPVVIF